MPTRRQFVYTSSFAAMAPALSSGKSPEEPPIFSFGLMADCQYADSDRRGSRCYRESPGKLKAAVEELNKHDLAFSFHVGDFIDRDFSSFDVLIPITSKLQTPLFHALGNHDFDVKDDEKSAVPGKLGLKNGYYSFSKHGFRLIIIDTTEVSPYRNPTGTALHDSATEELQRLREQGAPGAKPWNGRPGDQQMTWLTSELKAATAAGEKVIILGHHPILPKEAHAIWNADQMNELLQTYPCAKVYINGHNHAGHYTDVGGLHYLTLDGMLETPDTNAFSIARVFEDRLEIQGHGRQESYEFKFRKSL